jgi:hypothetical protein
MPDGCVDVFVIGQGDVVIAGPAGFRIAENMLSAATPGQRMSLLTNLVLGSFAAADPVVDRPVARAVAALRAHRIPRLRSWPPRSP